MRILHEVPIEEKRFGNDIKKNLWQRFVSNQLAFFLIIMVIQFIYCWFPYFIMPVLGAFSSMCMIKPTNYLLSQLTGSNGLGIGSFTFSWFSLTWALGIPLVVPRWAVVNIAVGFVLATWVITPIIYFANVWNTYNRPIAEVTGSTSNWSALGLVSTAAAFANLSAVFVHMLLHHSKNLWKELRTRSLDKKGNDVHCWLIALYPDVPDRWFGIFSLLAFIVIIVIGNVSSIILWYKSFFALVVSMIVVLPFGMVTSITGQSIQNPSVYYLLVIIATSLWVDDKSTMLAFVTIGYSTYCQTMQLVTNMKLGHYMKIAPRTLFLVQSVACLVTPALSIGMQVYFFKNGGFITNHTTAVTTGSFELTSVGAAIDNQTKFFGSANWKNRNFLWSLLIGAVLSIPFWLASRRWKWCHLIHIPLTLTFISWMSIVSAGSLFTWLLIGLLTTVFFNKFYWKRHVYLASAALNAGFYLCWLIIGGPLAQYGINFPSWWGFGGRNADGCPLSLMNGSAFYANFQK
jgi:OPT family oligopeptide transporter